MRLFPVVLSIFTGVSVGSTVAGCSSEDACNPARVVKADYQVTLQVRGSTKVRFFEYDDIGRIWQNAEKLTVEGIPPYPEAFDGQFMHFSVVSVRGR